MACCAFGICTPGLQVMPSKDFLERTDPGGALSLHRDAILFHEIHHKEQAGVFGERLNDKIAYTSPSTVKP